MEAVFVGMNPQFLSGGNGQICRHQHAQGHIAEPEVNQLIPAEELHHYEKAISELVSLLRKDELNETYHSLLILAYAKSGQRLAAQRQYARLTEVLKDELGVKPSLDIQSLCKDLRLGPAM
jgi:DNA-binding SARP family transcriptional activator